MKKHAFYRVKSRLMVDELPVALPREPAFQSFSVVERQMRRFFDG